MKWSIQQLQKLTVKPYQFEGVLDFTELAKDVSDIIEIKPLEWYNIICKNLK